MTFKNLTSKSNRDVVRLAQEIRNKAPFKNDMRFHTVAAEEKAEVQR